MRIALISCSKTKLDRAAPARELYRGDLFRLSVAYAEQRCDEWLVLSAEHGLVSPDEVIEPYDTTLASLSSEGRTLWGRRVLDQAEVLIAPETTLVLLAGERYREPFEWRGVWLLEVPMRGLAIGQQRSWLRTMTAREAA